MEQEQQQPTFYQIDFTKVETLEDVKNIINGLRILFTKDAPAFEEIKGYIKEVE